LDFPKEQVTSLKNKRLAKETRCQVPMHLQPKRSTYQLCHSRVRKPDAFWPLQAIDRQKKQPTHPKNTVLILNARATKGRQAQAPLVACSQHHTAVA
jgi:hypothetical protein